MPAGTRQCDSARCVAYQMRMSLADLRRLVVATQAERQPTTRGAAYLIYQPSGEGSKS